MSRRRSSFPLDQVLAESLEPRILYSASPMPHFSGWENLDADCSGEAVHVGHAWPEPGAPGIEGAAESEHHLSHLLDQTASEDDRTLLGDWIAARLS
jgi:hypothetical protein